MWFSNSLVKVCKVFYQTKDAQAWDVWGDGRPIFSLTYIIQWAHISSKKQEFFVLHQRQFANASHHNYDLKFHSLTMRRYRQRYSELWLECCEKDEKLFSQRALRVWGAVEHQLCSHLMVWRTWKWSNSDYYRWLFSLCWYYKEKQEILFEKDQQAKFFVF